MCIFVNYADFCSWTPIMDDDADQVIVMGNNAGKPSVTEQTGTE